VDLIFGYTGRPFDASTGLQNNLNRWYDAVVGRWTSEDPTGFADDANPFRYVGNGPVSAIDPVGLAELTAGKLREALPYAELAESAYTNAGMTEGKMVGDYQVKQVIDTEGGFRAVWFESTVNGEGVLAFAGTETPSLGKGLVDLVVSSAVAAEHAVLGHSGEEIPRGLFKPWHDVITDVHQGGGGVNIQYEQAIRASRQLKELYGDNLTVVGHSLGGGMATAAALVNGIHAKVYNPAGVHRNTLRQHGVNFDHANELVDVFKLWADPLTTLQDRLGLMPDTAGTVYEIPAMDNGLTFWLNNHGMSRLIKMIRELLGGDQKPSGGKPGGPDVSVAPPAGGGGKSC
jgi:RHS repeat-associated protein